MTVNITKPALNLREELASLKRTDKEVLPDNLENRIINGSFDFWQRSASNTGTGYIAADRWFQVREAGTVTMSRGNFALGEKVGGNSPKHFLRQTIAGQGAGNRVFLLHRVEGARSYGGETITVLGFARRISGSGDIGLYLYRNYGSGGSPSSGELAGGNAQTIELTSAYQPFAITFNVLSLSGKTIGNDGNDFLEIGFENSGGSVSVADKALDLWGIHIKRGRHQAEEALNYVQPEIGPELLRCQRYFTKHFRGVGKYLSTTSTILNGSFPVTMRAAPAAALIAGTQVLEMGVANRDASALTASALTPEGGYILVTTAAATSGNISAADTSVATFDAEL